MLRSISLKQFQEWIAYSDVEPFDEVRADLRSAQICATIANNNPNRKRGSKSYTAGDFLMKFGQETKRKQTWQQMEVMARAYSAAWSDLPDMAAPKPNKKGK